MSKIKINNYLENKSELKEKIVGNIWRALINIYNLINYVMQKY